MRGKSHKENNVRKQVAIPFLLPRWGYQACHSSSMSRSELTQASDQQLALESPSWRRSRQHSVFLWKSTKSHVATWLPQRCLLTWETVTEFFLRNTSWTPPVFLTCIVQSMKLLIQMKSINGCPVCLRSFMHRAANNKIKITPAVEWHVCSSFYVSISETFPIPDTQGMIYLPTFWYVLW